MSVGVSSTELCQRLPQLPAKVQFRYVRVSDMQILFVYDQVFASSEITNSRFSKYQKLFV